MTTQGRGTKRPNKSPSIILRTILSSTEVGHVVGICEISFQKTSSPLHSAFSFLQEEILGNIPKHWEVLGANSTGI